MLLRQIFDPYLAQYAYLIGCQRTGEALIVDPERDIDRYQNLAAENGLRITAAAETHIHADFVSGLREFAEDAKLDIYLSAEGGPDWTYQWQGDRPRTHLLKNGAHFMVGNIRIQAVHTPGHTPEHLSFLVTDIGGGADQPLALISGDFLFVGDVGRPDLLESAAGMKDVMEPSARTLRQSLNECLSTLADHLQILPAHGAGSSCGKSLGAVPTSTLGYERRFNHALKLAQADGPAFVKEILLGQPDPPLYFATMKRVNRDGIRVTRGVPKVAKLTAAELAKRATESGVKILDTRENREAFDAAHVRGAINAPLRSAFFTTAAGSFLEEDDKILLVLEDAADADLAARQLYRIGFDHLLGWITLSDAKAGDLLIDVITRIPFTEFDKAAALREGEIIDVRTTAEFQRGHINGARSLPYTRLKEHLNELPKDRRLFVHCGTGKRATLATSFLRAEGFDAVHVDGAFNALP